MSRLLSAGFARLWKSAVFYLGLIVMAAYAALIIFSRGQQAKDFPILLHGLVIPFVIAVFVGLFIGSEYGDGTIRNKLIVGHSRGSIYFSNFIVCTVAGALMNVVYMAIVAVCMFAFAQQYQIDQTLPFYICCSFAVVTAFIALFLMISMLIQSKAIGAVAALVCCCALFLGAMNISRALSAPEYFEGYMVKNEQGDVEEIEKEKNPYYLRGTKRKVYEFLWEYLPYCQAAQLQAQGIETGSIVKMPLYSLSLIVISTAVGIAVFYRKDLK